MTIALGSSRTAVLPVPYFTQPTGITCQSTCLKMIATYLEQSVVRQSTWWCTIRTAASTPR